MSDLSRHPLLRECHDLIQVIEEFPPSELQTRAVIRASDLLGHLDKSLFPPDGSLAPPWRDADFNQSSPERVVPLPSLFSLVEEVIQEHADPKSSNYNECDTGPCFWCESAQKAMAGLPQEETNG